MLPPRTHNSPVSKSAAASCSDARRIGAILFEGAPGGYKLDGNAPSPDYVDEFLSSPEGLRLVKAFRRIARPAVRHRIVNVVQEIAAADGD
jgi:hypothetical protein